MIIAGIPYAAGGSNDLGRAYNEFFDRLRPGDWGVVLDHDAMNTTRTWYRILEGLVETHGDRFPLIWGAVNRVPSVKSGWQYLPGVDPSRDDHEYHEALGEKQARKAPILYDVTTIMDRDQTPGSGAAFLLSRDVWAAAGRWPEGRAISGHDWWIHRQLRRRGYRIGFTPSWYVYHACAKARGKWRRLHQQGQKPISRLRLEDRITGGGDE